MFSVHRKQGLFFTWMSLKKAGKRQNLEPMWKKLMQNVVLDGPTSFLDHVCLGCTQRECKPNERIIEQHTQMFQSRILERQIPHAHTVALSHDLRDMLKNVSSGTVNWQIRKWSNCRKLRILVWMITNSSRTRVTRSNHGRGTGWVMQGVLSRASFRRSPVSGQETFTVMSLHISNIYAKKRGIAKKVILTIRAIMISQQVDVVAGAINGTARRCRSRNNFSTIDEAFTDCVLPTPPCRTPLW